MGPRLLVVEEEVGGGGVEDREEEDVLEAVVEVERERSDVSLTKVVELCVADLCLSGEGGCCSGTRRVEEGGVGRIADDDEDEEVDELAVC